MADFGAVVTAMVTPMRQDGAVDFDQAAALAERLVQSGSDGLVVCGTTGESATLRPEEKVRLFEVVVEAVRGRGSVIAGTGANDTAVSVELTRAADGIGVDGILAVVPYYNLPPQEGLYRHFRAIAAATERPVMLYNVPGRTGRNLDPDTVVRLAESARNILAIKEASKDLDQLARIVAETGPEFAVYSGDDSLTLPILAVGGHGVVSVASHLAGEEIAAMIGDYQAGRVDEAARRHRRLLPLIKSLFITTNPIPLKAALELDGFPVGPPRLPLVEATPAEREALRASLERHRTTAGTMS